jgi:hypothetical protein
MNMNPPVPWWVSALLWPWVNPKAPTAFLSFPRLNPVGVAWVNPWRVSAVYCEGVVYG